MCVHHRYNGKIQTYQHETSPYSNGPECCIFSQATPNQLARMNAVPYSEAIRSVLWPAIVSRPDITFAVGILSQFIQSLGQAHWEALKRVINYLHTTKDLWLTFSRWVSHLVEAFCDADWAGQNDCHSISRYTFYFGQGAVSWSSKKQHIIVLSSTESEYIAQTQAAKEAIWLKNFVSEICQPQEKPIEIYCDNQGVIALVKDNKYHSQMKHINLQYHFIREAVKDNIIKFEYIPTQENIADVFMKALVRPRFKGFVEGSGLRESEEKGQRQ